MKLAVNQLPVRELEVIPQGQDANMIEAQYGMQAQGQVLQAGEMWNLPKHEPLREIVEWKPLENVLLQEVRR